MKMKFIGSLIVIGILLVGCGGGTTVESTGTQNNNSGNNLGESTAREKQYSVRRIPKNLCESLSFQNAIKEVMPSEANALFKSVDHHGCGIINDTCSYGPYFDLSNAKNTESKLCRIEYNGSIDKDAIHSTADEQLAIYYTK